MARLKILIVAMFVLSLLAGGCESKWGTAGVGAGGGQSFYYCGGAAPGA